MQRSLLFPLLLLVFTVACASETTMVDAPAEPPLDLQSCGPRLACDEVCSHQGWGDCSSGDFAELRSCVDETLLASTPGAILNLERPGPGNWEGQILTIVIGDGTVVRQTRSRTCTDVTCSLALQPWVVEAQERCRVFDDGTECAPQDGPSGNVCSPAAIADCEVVPVDEELTCADVP